MILASTSKYRSALLSQLGYAFECASPGVDEDAYKGRGTAPEELALILSRAKAEAVFKKHPDACVIGSDQVCTLEGMILSKPGTVEKAVEQLLFMQNKTHELLTAVTICSPKGRESVLNKTKLKMRPLTRAQIEAYVQYDMPLDCAGSYKLETSGIKLFSEIDMTDHTSIIGLPLIDVTTLLLKLGYPL